MDDRILEQATSVVEDYLTVVEAEIESKAALRSGRYVCSCNNCRTQRRDALEWLEGMHAGSGRSQAA